ncbi:glycosyltransferase family 2 protein [Limnohabitans sp. 2KL-3]|uniref:glycosyltransferase family 2 protein n=1 Tax=Limnohabitans sp. 2KL-3 TaxID=1100700 RepID=UPI000A716580|nr:glycosyltransferase family 2 protein [Limnohabitans sp. 2KL-3]
MSQEIHVVSAVIVCFHPNPETLHRLILALAPDVHQILLVNNGQVDELPSDLGAQVQCIELGCNLGVAEALNRGFAKAYAEGADAVIGFDQDSEPPVGLVSQMRDHWNGEVHRQSHLKFGAIGPATCDRDGAHLLTSFAPYNWMRQRIRPTSGKRWHVDHLITSGCLIPREAWEKTGPMNADLFIDWVDVEWCGRARAAGYTLLMDGDAVLIHRIGHRSQAFLGRHFHVHSPFRHYFVLRNALLLWSDKRFPTGWRAHHLLYALRVILANLIFAPGRLQRLIWVARGWRDGWAKRTGAQGHIPD